MGILRLFFAISVLFGHIGVNLGISPIYAVQGFYIISGFYMSMILNEKYVDKDSNVTFYKKRFYRLAPTYWLISAFAIVLSVCYYLKGESNILFFDSQNFPSNASMLTYLFIILSNIFIIGQDIALFMGISPDTGQMFFSASSFAEEYPMLRYMLVPVAWSVSTEFCFYIIAPHILRNNKKIVCLIVLISIISNFFTNYMGLNDSNWRFRFFPSTLLFFLTGYFAYLIYKKISKKNYNTFWRYLTISTILIIITFLLNLNVSFAIHSVMLLSMGLLIIPYIFNSFKSDKVDRTIGEMSYPLYLIHPLFIGLNDLFGIHSPLFVILGSLIGAYCCYVYYISPLERFRSKIR